MAKAKSRLKRLKAGFHRISRPHTSLDTSRASTVYEGFKTTLRVIERSSDVFTPLKSAVGGLLGLIDVLENAHRNEEDCASLESKLSIMISVMNNSKSTFTNAEAAERIEKLSKSLTVQVATAKSIHARGPLAKAANATKDREEIAAAYQEISQLLDMFLVETALAVERVTSETHDTTSKHYIITLLDKLQPVEQAQYNATSPVPRRACTENTRIEILSSFVSWALDSNDWKIYFLNGMAGTGKTTLAYTLSHLLEKMGLLGGTFFCSRADQSCSDANRIASTLAFHLAQYSPQICKELVQVLDESSGQPGHNVDLRFNNLIVKPLRAVAGLINSPIIVVIDALDECRTDSHVSTLMHNLWLHASNLPVKFFVTSRPERLFHDKIYGHNDISMKFHLHNVESSLVERDIRLFLDERLRTLANDYRSRRLYVPSDWPPESQLNELTKQSGKLFIYAATACQYIGGSKVDLSERLEQVIELGLKASKARTDPLDSLYTGVLNDAYEGCEENERNIMNQILRSVVSVITPLSVSSLAELLKMDPHKVTACLSLFHSVLNVQMDGSLVTTLHASFPDYISDQDRSQKFFLDSARSHSILASFSFNLMEEKLKENICDQDGYPNNNAIPGALLEQRVSPALSYACSHWPIHVCVSGNHGTVNNSLKFLITNFFETRSLMWIECLSYCKALYRSAHLLSDLEGWASMTDPNLVPQIRDVRRFISQNIDLLSINALESYCSALIWLPQASFVRQKFSLSRSLPNVVSGLPTSWDPCEMILTGHSRFVDSVAFSPNGGRIASGSWDTTVRIWTATTGELEQELTGHSHYVHSVAFSPDGTRIASGSEDKTVRIWNAISGESEQELTGHSHRVWSVAFSPDGARIASGSEDKTVRIWNAISGESEQELTGHSHRVWSVGFSPDGARIASGSEDKTVRIWNAISGESEQELTGHSASVCSIAFSPDSARIASGSEDQTVQIWNAISGESEQELTGHSGSVCSVAFSPDSVWIASGSSDHTVRIWNATTVKPEHCFSHSATVCSVAFSPNGARIASGSYDNTVRMWNARTTSESKHMLTGHSGSVCSVAFSPDGARVASGSEDQTVHIWNGTTGESEHILTGHSGAVQSVALSPDGVRIASGSEDRTVRIWNAVTGKSEHELNGHLLGVNSVAFSPDGSRIASGAMDATVRIWNADTGKSEYELIGRIDGIRSVVYSPDGARIASVSWLRTLQIWNATTGTLEHNLVGREGRTAELRSIAFCPNGTRIFAESSDGTVLEWNVASGEQLQKTRRQAAYLSGYTLPSSHLYLNAGWLNVSDTSRKYWIPHEYAGMTHECYHSNKAAFGYETGRIVIVIV